MIDKERFYWNGEQYAGFLIIENHDIHAGFTALMIYALNGIRQAKALNLIPVIDFNEHNCQYFFDAEKGPSVWEYYFESISPYTVEQLSSWQKSGKLAKDAVRILSSEESQTNHHHDPRRIATFWAQEEPKNKQAWMTEKRDLGRQYVTDYIRPMPHISQRVDAFVKDNFCAKTIIGVHIRGTDFTYAKPISIENYTAEIDKISQEHNDDFQIFVATDQQQYLQQFIDRYGERVISSDAIRSDNHIAPFRFEHLSGYQKGEDVLLDILLLSKCRHVLKGPAAVGEMALWFNHHSNNNIRDFAIESQFIDKSYAELEAAFIALNIDQKNSLALKYHRVNAQLIRRLVGSRPGIILYSKFSLLRKLLKH